MRYKMLLSTLVFTATTLQAAPLVMEFKASEDASVKESSPSSNYGKATILEADASPVSESFVKFNVSGISGHVTSAKVRFVVANGSKERPAIFQSSSSWAESTLNWNNRPMKISGELDGMGSISSGSTTLYDVSDVVTKDGVYSFNLASRSTDGSDYSSRETSNAPMLILTVESSGTDYGTVSIPLVNPGFESGSTGWTVKNGSVVTSGVGSGTRSMRIGTSTGYANQNVTGLKPGVSYDLSALARISSSSAQGYIGIAFKDSNGVKVAEPKVQVKNTSYGNVSLKFTAPSSFASAYIFARTTNSGYYLFADNAALSVAGTAPTTEPVPAPAPAPAPSPAPSTGANLIFQESFEDNSFDVHHKQFCCSYSFGIVSSPAYTGSKAGKFELRDSDAITSGGTRAEVIVTPNTTHKHRWYSFANFFPSDYVADSSSEVIAQWWQKSGVTQSISLRVQNDRLILRAGGTSSSLKTYDLAPISKNVWQDLVFHIIHSSGTDGLIEVYKNGALIKKITGPNTYSDAPLPNFKVGIYKASWNSGSTQTSKRTLYYDDIRVGNENAVLSDMRAK